MGIALAAGLLAACADEELQPVQPLPATIAQLTGPWQAEPFVLDPGVWARAETGCRKDMLIGPGGRAVIVDARGAGVLMVRISGASVGGCHALQILADGTINGAGSGFSGSGPERLDTPRDLGIIQQEVADVGGGDLKTTGWSVTGLAGRGVAAVVVAPGGAHPLVRATLANGWYAAWWPTLPGEGDPFGREGRPADPPHVVIRAYDVTGNQVDEVQT
jgi:hypothetical protein